MPPPLSTSPRVLHLARLDQGSNGVHGANCSHSVLSRLPYSSGKTMFQTGPFMLKTLLCGKTLSSSTYISQKFELWPDCARVGTILSVDFASLTGSRTARRACRASRLRTRFARSRKSRASRSPTGASAPTCRPTARRGQYRWQENPECALQWFRDCGLTGV